MNDVKEVQRKKFLFAYCDAVIGRDVCYFLAIFHTEFERIVINDQIIA